MFGQADFAEGKFNGFGILRSPLVAANGVNHQRLLPNPQAISHAIFITGNHNTVFQFGTNKFAFTAPVGKFDTCAHKRLNKQPCLATYPLSLVPCPLSHNRRYPRQTFRWVKSVSDGAIVADVAEDKGTAFTPHFRSEVFRQVDGQNRLLPRRKL